MIYIFLRYDISIQILVSYNPIISCSILIFVLSEITQQAVELQSVKSMKKREKHMIYYFEKNNKAYNRVFRVKYTSFEKNTRYFTTKDLRPLTEGDESCKIQRS